MTDVTQRSYWISTLAQSEYAQIVEHWKATELEPSYQVIRQPEIGLAQVRARMGSTGNPFNMGDVTITRAAIKLDTGEMGYSYLCGRNKPHAELAAVIDGMLQSGVHRQALMQQIIEPLAALKFERDQQRAKEVATSKVDFFTLVRGED
ncbi:phosphonate C-P lyase system protein PhnG [Vibrio brasiliensis]|uniref:phosphonate C-P lyase system protein PhnG n=1 Tax=Vibrio brasiliensis TaxID=170652 RepID=UPI001EFD1C6D|nr:phosphonate C-P lyase system protein PhnG [Vibrio brasiliensis]MCG9752515.1 phosphonate C-P lyase system protein PhnG [Vibrio brasiliensis]